MGGKKLPFIPDTFHVMLPVCLWLYKYIGGAVLESLHLFLWSK